MTTNVENMQAVLTHPWFGILLSVVTGAIATVVIDSAKRNPGSRVATLGREYRVPWRVKSVMIGVVVIALVWSCWLWLPDVWEEYVVLTPIHENYNESIAAPLK